MVSHSMVHIYELSVPILMTVWLVEFSTTSAVLGTAAAIGYGLFGVGALPGGLLVDRFGSRRLIVACLVGMSVSFLVLSLAPGVIGITVALALWGLAASIYHPAGLTLISNGVQDRGQVFAYHGMAGNAGIAGGPLVTALLLLTFEWRLVAAILAVPAAIAAVIGLTVSFDPTAAVDVDDGEPERRSPASLAEFGSETRRLFTIGFLLVFCIVSFNGLYYRGVLTFLPELLGDFLTAAVGDVQLGLFDPDSPVAAEFDLSRYLYAGLLTVGIGGQYLGGRLTDRIEPDRGLTVMLGVLTTIALVFVPLVQTGLAGLLLGSFVLGVALFAIQPLSQATIAKYSLPESRGLSFGYTYLAIFGIGALGAAITGTVLTYSSVSVMFLVLASLSTIGVSLGITLLRRQ
ncbi:MFS transporter [Halohasta litorea]|uniref:MFS transporter n=1 Tax=Halohasta litorea TaxID=869891 RepID=A0ABD6DCQ8_9EURY|nr:MFS transporter [Halohasta litorea]MEA1930686.1 MFS transporter [Euryarchaeota archaeon]